MRPHTANDLQTKRLHYLCRRGTRELEVLLVNYLEQYYPQANTRQQSVFRWLLHLEDDRLWDWILLETQATPVTTKSAQQLHLAINVYIEEMHGN